MDENGWRQVEIRLEPLNSDFDPIVVATDYEAGIQLMAELVEVVA